MPFSTLPRPDLAHHLTKAIKAQQPSPMKAFAKMVGDRKLVSLAGGMPHPSLFPMQHAEFTLPAYSALTGDVTAWREGRAPTSIAHLKKTGPGTENDPAGVLDLNEVLQYGLFVGYPELSKKLVELNNLLHGNLQNTDVYISLGNTDGVNKVFTLFVEPGDTVLAEEFSFTNSLNAARAKGANIHPIKMDDKGILPEDLDRVLSTWSNRPKPRLLYTIPCGQNPTGSVLPNDRYGAVYAIAQKHDVLIIEDDPYFALQYRPYEEKRQPPVLPPLPATPADDDLSTLARVFNHYAGIHSYLSRDADGRVLRIDTFSKLFGPGIRLGWVTASPLFVEKLIRTGETATQVPSNLSQAILASYLSDTHWGMSGWLRWTWSVRLEYERKRNFFMDALERHVPAELVSTRATMAGMFQWLRIAIDSHPRFVKAHDGTTNTRDLMDELSEALIDANVLLMPARLFQVPIPGVDQAERLNFFRATFAGDTKTIDNALANFGATVEKFFKH